MRPYLQLVRFPVIFGSMSNAFAGYWIGGAVAGERAAWPALVLALVAAALFVAAGMALNDIADVEVDRKERPERPLPSGRIPLSRAWILVAAFFALGLACQWLANPVSAQVGALLVAAIFLYNFVLKGTFAGPVSMASCRVLNLAAGMALGFSSLTTFAALPAAAYGALASLGLYVALVTFLARDEVTGNAPGRVRVFFVGFAAWFAGWAAFASTVRGWTALAVAGVLLLFLWLLRHALAGLRRSPSSPASTGKTVGGMLGVMPVTDALGMLAAGIPFGWALAGLLWILPGRLARRIAVT
jgi:4-hydroxybenzoate polyprenyltransferase